MASLAEVRQMMQDKKASNEGLGQLIYPIPTDVESVELYRSTQERRAQAVKDGKDRMSGPDTAELDAELARLEEVINKSTLRLAFRALPGEDYQKIINEHNLRSPEGIAEFTRELLDKCYRHTIDGDGEKHPDLPLEEVLAMAVHGVYDDLGDEVVAINRRKVDLDFLSRR